MNGQQPTVTGVDASVIDGATSVATTGVPSHDHGPAVPCDCDKTCGEGWPFIIGVALLVMWIARLWSRRRKKAEDPARPAPDARGRH
jgi:hypothetical protein